jgi:ketopantoate reductase
MKAPGCSRRRDRLAGHADLALARWQKLVWNVPYNGLSVLLGASTTPLMADSNSRELMQALMAEVVQGAAACVLPEGYAEHLFQVTERMPDYWPSMYHDRVTNARWSWGPFTPSRWHAHGRQVAACRALKCCTKR